MILYPCREDPGTGNIITFAQFLFIALEGLIFTSHFLQKDAVVPIRYEIRRFTVLSVLTLVMHTIIFSRDN